MDINGKKIRKQKHPNSPPCHLQFVVLLGVLLAVCVLLGLVDNM